MKPLLCVLALTMSALAQQWSYSGSSICYHFTPQSTSCSTVGSVEGYVVSQSTDAQHAEAMRENYETAQTIGQNAGSLIGGLFQMWAQHRARVKAERESLQNEYRKYAEASDALMGEFEDMNRQIIESSNHLTVLDPKYAIMWQGMSTLTATNLPKLTEMHVAYRAQIATFSTFRDRKVLKQLVQTASQNYDFYYKLVAKEYVMAQLLHGLELYYGSQPVTANAAPQP